MMLGGEQPSQFSAPARPLVERRRQLNHGCAPSQGADDIVKCGA